jgi:hypothetical protein
MPLQGGLTVDLSLAGDGGAQTVDLAITGDEAFFGLARLDSADFGVRMQEAVTAFSADIAGYYRGDTTITARGDVSQTDTGTAVTLSRLDAQIGPHAVALEEAFRLTASDGRYGIAPVSLAIGDGSADLALGQRGGS